MDELIQKLIDTHKITEYEALIAIGIMGMVAYSDNTLDTVYDTVNENIKAIVKNTLTMA